MASGKQHPVYSPEKQRIVDIHQDGKSTCHIVRIVGRSSSVVKLIVVKCKSSGSIKSSPGSDIPHKTSHLNDRVITETSLPNRFKSTAEI